MPFDLATLHVEDITCNLATSTAKTHVKLTPEGAVKVRQVLLNNTEVAGCPNTVPPTPTIKTQSRGCLLGFFAEEL